MANTTDQQSDRPLTVPSLLRRRTVERGDYIFHVCDDEKISYTEAEKRSGKLAKGLIAAGIVKGSHVAILYPTGPDFIVAVLAVARIGAVAVPLSTLSTPDELRWLLSNSDASLLLADQNFRSQDFIDILKTAFPGLNYCAPTTKYFSESTPWLRRICFSGPLPEGFDSSWSVRYLEELGDKIEDPFLQEIENRVSPDDLFVILHTSGSTGTPKGVMHTHGNMLTHLFNTNEVRCYGRDDIFYTTFPWFWVAGFAFGFIGTLVAGARILFSNSTDTGKTLDLLERERPTITNGFWRSVLKYTEHPDFSSRNLSSIRRGNLYPILAPEVRPKDPALRHDIYGMSETGGAVALSPDESDLPEAMRGSCGNFLPTYEARIVDTETGEECPRGEPGELWLRSPLMTVGYYGKPRNAVYTADGWYRTNDIGIIDGNGYFFLRGRTGDMIKTNAVNVAPREVESVLSALLNNQPCIVLGIPDEERGQLVAAVVVSEIPFSEAEIRQKLKERLSSYKVPQRILRFSQSEMPLLATGKYEMRKLTTMVQDRWKFPAG